MLFRSYIKTYEYVPIPQLMSDFNVSKSTIIRDLSILDEQGLIERIHGGARALSDDRITKFNIREKLNEKEKTAIVRRAAMQVHDNDTIYLEYKKNWEAAKKAYDEGDSLSYQNYLVDQELALLKQQNDAKNTAYRKANQNTQTATKRKDNYKSKLDSVKKKGKSYSKKYAKYLTAEQEKQLAAGKKINTDNIKNANVKKIIDQYNIDLQNAMNSYTAATQQLTAAQEAEAEAAANAAPLRALPVSWKGRG